MTPSLANTFAVEGANQARHTPYDASTLIFTQDEIRKYFEARLRQSLPMKNKIAVCCPFHDDRSPSATVFLTGNGGFNCNGCGAKGNILQFEMRHQNCDMQTAKANVAAITGATAPIDGAEKSLEAVYDYRKSDGTVAFQKRRYRKADSTKTFLIYRPEGKGWASGMGDAPKVLYNFPALVTASLVFVAEGEKDADNLTALNLWPNRPDLRIAATCNFEGAWQPGQSPKWLPQYSPLFSGKQVVVFEDNDAAGRAWADYVCNAVLPYAEGVRRVSFPEMPEKSDVSDYLESHSPQDLAQMIQKAPRWSPVVVVPEEIGQPLDNWPEPEPLYEALPDVAQFDLELMPDSFRLLVQDVSGRMQVPMDFPAVTAIATLAGVTNRRALIQPKRDDDSWTVVPNLWGGIVGLPGMLKSPTISCMTQPVRAIEKEWRDAYTNQEQAYNTALELHELDVDAWKQQCKAASKKGEAKPAKPELAQTPPTPRRLFTSDATFEAIHTVLSENPAGIFVLRDELTGWLAGLERQGREQERAFYLESWNGDSAFTIDRIGRGNVYVPHVCTAIFGGIQPSPLRQYFADALKGGPSNDGLIQRFQLLVWPDVPKGWQYIDRKPNVDALEHAAKVCRRIAQMDAESPLLLKFDADAQILFEQWLSDLEQRIRSDDLHPAMQAHLSKYRSLMPALALLFTLADGRTDCVPVSEAQLAADWCGYLETHAARVYACQVRPEHQAAIVLSKRLAGGWKRKEGVFTVRDVYRNGWEMLDSPDSVRAALLVLQEYGWVREDTAGNDRGLGRPTETYKINPRIGGEHASE